MKYDGTRREKSNFVFAAKRTSPIITAGGCQFSRLLAAEICASAVIMLDKPCFEVVRRVQATYCIRQLPSSLPLPYVTLCHHISTELYSCNTVRSIWKVIKRRNKTTLCIQKNSTMQCLLSVYFNN